MRDGWVETTLGEVSALQMGRTPSRREKSYWTDDLTYPFCTIADMDAKYVDPKREGVTKAAIMDGKAKMATKGTLLMSFKLTIGRMGFAARDIFPNEAIVMIEADESNVLNEFLYLRLASMDLTEGSGRAVKGSTLNSASIASIAFLVPPLPEQKRIVDLISSVDSYIEALQQQRESAKRSRNAVLHELLTAGGDDWVERKLPEVVEVLDRMRKPINSTEREERKGNIPYYGANGQTGWIDEFIFNEELVLLGEDAIDFADPSARKAYLIQGPSWVNNHAHVLRADKTIVNSYFLMESLNKVDYSQYVSFGTRSKLTQASMNGIKLHIPPIKIQEKIVDLLENFDEMIESTQRSIEDSKLLRSGMLSNLLSGDYEIPSSYDKVMGAA